MRRPALRSESGTAAFARGRAGHSRPSKKGLRVGDNLHPSVCSVIPPHILQHVAEHADGDACTSAIHTLAHMDGLTHERTAQFFAGVTATAAPRKRRNVYDARNGLVLPGKLVLSEHRVKGTDVEINEAFDGSGATYDFYSEVFGRSSIDGRGLRIDSTVHFGRRFSNAMWNGNQIVYGEGDGQLFTRFTAAIDVTGHELTHGVVQHTAGLAYTGQTGALNEHLADAFGIMVKQYTLGQTAEQSDWIIGAGLFGPRVNGKGLRSMAAPGTAYDDPVLGRDPQPAHMRDYVKTADDNGGVHINSGIPNHAFYLAAIELGGRSWGVLGKIWYTALTRHLKPASTFSDLAIATVLVAGEIFGIGSRSQRVVAEAWRSVGLPVNPPRVSALAIRTAPSHQPLTLLKGGRT